MLGHGQRRLTGAVALAGGVDGRGAAKEVVDRGAAGDGGGDGASQAQIGGGVAGVTRHGDQVARSPDEGGHFTGGEVDGCFRAVGVLQEVGESAGLHLVGVQRTGSRGHVEPCGTGGPVRSYGFRGWGKGVSYGFRGFRGLEGGRMRVHFLSRALSKARLARHAPQARLPFPLPKCKLMLHALSFRSRPHLNQGRGR